LVACNCKTLSEQKVILEKPKNRRVFDQVKEDASSPLFVLYDSASITSGRTASSENSSRISKIFSFDIELMSTRVYQGSFRSLYKRTLRRGKGTDLDSTKLRSATRSDLPLEFNKGRLKRVRVLVMGTDDSEREAIMNQMKTVHQDEFTVEERQVYRNRICNKIIDDMHLYKHNHGFTVGEPTRCGSQ
jgi:hypothetical protein